MAKKAYELTQDSSYGRKGQIVNLEGELTDRQNRLMREYKKPVAVADESAELKALKTENHELKTKLAEVEQQLEVATPDPKAK